MSLGSQGPIRSSVQSSTANARIAPLSSASRSNIAIVREGRIQGL